MVIATVQSATVSGVQGVPVSVEVHVSNGLPSFGIVGLPDAACREARDRVRAALLSSGLPWPTRRVTVNLAPSGVRKVGTAFDLPIAIGLLVTADVLPPSILETTAFAAELGLDGAIRPVNAVVPLVGAMERRSVVVACRNASHASLVPERDVLCAWNLTDLVAGLKGEGSLGVPSTLAASANPTPESDGDMADVRGQPVARWAVEIAAAGGHNLLLSGPPGSGKTMLARRLRGLLPDLDDVSSMTATRIHSAAGMLDAASGPITRPPLRSPHHTASVVSIIGGGSSVIRPGEASLSHAGILFLDELGEFARPALDSLRQPLEEGLVRIARASGTAIFPADFQLIAATNPCPCGEYSGPVSCACDQAAITRYRARLSGPLLDRFDMRVIVGRPAVAAFVDEATEECSQAIADRVAAARARALHERGVLNNASLRDELLRRHAPLTAGARNLVRFRLERGLVTGRGVDRVRRVALTIADLNGDEGPLTEEHFAAAFELHFTANPAVAA